MSKHTGRGGSWSRRRTFLKGVGTVGALGLGVLPGSHRVGADYINDGGGGSTSVTFASTQADFSGIYISASTRVKHLGTSELSDGRFNHSYRIVHESTSTKDGSKVESLSAQKHVWDATDDSTNVDCAQDDASPNVGAWPKNTQESAPENVFEEVIKTAAGALADEAGVAISAATIIEEILNAIDDYYADTDRKRWQWDHNVNGDKADTVSHQMDPIYRHDSSESTWWFITADADSRGNRVEFYSGNPPDLYATNYDGSDADSTNLSTSTQTDSPSGAGPPVFAGHTPGLSKADLHTLPPTADMTSKERETYGVREPTAKEQQFFGTEQADVVRMIDRYPMTYVGRRSHPSGK